jgi:hypothetical protein
MTRIKLDYVHEYLDRHGKLRRYFRRPGFKRIALPGAPGSDEFMAAYQRALDLAPRVEIGAERTMPGTIDALIVAYLKSDAFTKALAPETQRMRRNILDRFRIKHGAKRVITLERRNIVKIIESKKLHAQKNWLKTLRGLMMFAVAENYRADDPTGGVRAARPAIKSTGHMTWGDEQWKAPDRHGGQGGDRVIVECRRSPWRCPPAWAAAHKGGEDLLAATQNAAQHR